MKPRQKYRGKPRIGVSNPHEFSGFNGSRGKSTAENGEPGACSDRSNRFNEAAAKVPRKRLLQRAVRFS